MTSDLNAFQENFLQELRAKKRAGTDMDAAICFPHKGKALLINAIECGMPQLDHHNRYTFSMRCQIVGRIELATVEIRANNEQALLEHVRNIGDKHLLTDDAKRAVVLLLEIMQAAAASQKLAA